ncbi:MAG TPA: MFS transporter [Bryobacteraceae bacterium]|jgi:MFS family permease|nr:MFS transporter [Bryobacteraceae bacterium]
MNTTPSRRSFFGLNAANFLQAEMVGVVIPVLNGFLRTAGWSYDAIGVATAAAGLGTLAFQALAGWLTDRWKWRRAAFSAASVLTGISFAAIPRIPRTHVWIDSLLFFSGAIQSFFGPLLGALALGLAGHRLLNRTMGANQGWNHAGNIAAALLAMGVVSVLGLNALFYSVGVFSLFAAASMLLIRAQDLDEQLATGLTRERRQPVRWTELLGDPRVLFLFLAIFAFHLANAPILPTVALYVKHLGGSDKLMTATVLTAQLVMAPVSLAAGRLCDSVGRKPVMAAAFVVLPVRILSYSLVSNPMAVVWLQGLDGIGAGIYGVAVVAMAADLTRGKGHFNALIGLFASAVAVGGVLGPLASGLLVQKFGFRIAFYGFALLAAGGAALFLFSVPETRPADAGQ